VCFIGCLGVLLRWSVSLTVTLILTLNPNPNPQETCVHAAAQDFGKINVSTFAHTRRADSVPKLEGIWVRDDSAEKGATR